MILLIRLRHQWRFPYLPFVAALCGMFPAFSNGSASNEQSTLSEESSSCGPTCVITILALSIALVSIAVLVVVLPYTRILKKKRQDWEDSTFSTSTSHSISFPPQLRHFHRPSAGRLSFVQSHEVLERGLHAWQFMTSKNHTLYFVADQTHLIFRPPNKTIVTAQTNLALPRQQEMVYFEMTILSEHHKATIAVGLAKRKFKSNRHPGKVEGSMGYWNNGQVMSFGKEEVVTEIISEPFQLDDVVGIGYMPGSMNVFYTLNGQLLGTRELDGDEALFPTVSCDYPCEFYINIGQDEYQYKVASSNGSFAARPYSLPPYKLNENDPPPFSTSDVDPTGFPIPPTPAHFPVKERSQDNRTP